MTVVSPLFVPAAAAFWGEYTAAVLLATAVWVYALRARGFAFLALAMFFPGAFAAAFELAVGGPTALLAFAANAASLSSASLLYTAVGAVETVAFLAVVTGAGYAVGWTTRAPPAKGVGQPHEHNRSLLMAFLRAAGEELGWRSFLEPALHSAGYSLLEASLVVGAAWGLFHVPVMILLWHRKGWRLTLLSTLSQAVSCAVLAASFGWVGRRGGYAVWAPSMMHFVWNRVNPPLLGSIYTDTPGMFVGPQWLINGEGVLGTLVGLATLPLFLTV